MDIFSLASAANGDNVVVVAVTRVDIGTVLDIIVRNTDLLVGVVLEFWESPDTCCIDIDINIDETSAMKKTDSVPVVHWFVTTDFFLSISSIALLSQ